MWRTSLLNLQHIPYLQALRVMHALLALKGSGNYPQVLMQVEHEPVITLGRRSGPDDFVASSRVLSQKNIGVHRIERGGLATYHGPGQLVIYPIFDLRCMKLGVVQLVSGLEQAVIETLTYYDIKADRRHGYRGVWVGEDKIASVGIAIRKGISFHGIALNYAPDLANFDLIHPCGIKNVKMTSIANIIHQPIDIIYLRNKIAEKVALIFDLAIEIVTLSRMEKDLNMTLQSVPKEDLDDTV